ncbi:MAG: RidA family protein [Pseudorhodoplanes sp.]|uniref:RidA family protein n=1 Tax=Pseudorhodoplanes sp. TaxID=1934341 RepID=UPI003D111F8B
MTKRAKQIVPVEGLSKPSGVFSAVTAASPGKLVCVSGLLAKNTAGDVVGVGDMAAQTEQVIANLKLALSAAGATLDDVVRVDVYVTDMSKFDEIHAVRRKHFPVDPPASTMVEVSRLAHEKALIEITAMAVVA